MKKLFIVLTLLIGGLSAYGQSITNPSFEDGTNGWTVSKMQLQTNDGMSSYRAGNTYIERWIAAPGLLGSASAKQTVTGLTNGVYRLTVAAMNISQNNTNAAQVGAWIVANGLRTAVTTLNTYTLDFFVTDGTAEIGFVCDGASGNWVGCDNFTLTYRGNTSTYIQSAGNTVKNYANNLISSVGSDSQYSSLVSTLTSAINGGNLANVATAAKAVVAGERAYRLRHPSGSAPTITTNKRHARGSIWIFGRLSWSGSNVVEEGFCYSTNPNPTLENSNYSTDWIDSYGKVIWIQDLTPGTMYYIRPYAMTKNYAVGYGDVIKVPTLPQGDIHWSVRDSGDETADNHIRSSCEWGFDHFWDNLTQLTTFWPSIGHVSGVPTAECSYGGWCSVGDSWSYQNTGTILHEMLHGVGVGQHWMWGDFTRNQYPVWDALRFWNNNETEVLNGDGMHLWPYGINGAHEDNGSDQLYIGNALVCEALGEGGLPLTDGQWLLPYYAYPQDDNTKYYIKCEDKNRGLTTSYLVENSDGTLGWQAMSVSQAQSNNRAAWYLTFDASVQRYHIKNASTNHYIRYSSANANNGFTTGSSATDIQMKKCRVDVKVGSKTYQGYYFLDYGSGQSMEAKTDGVVGSTGFSIWDDATTQRWVILAEGSDVEAFENGAVEIQLDQLRRYLNGYTAAKNVSHTDKTSGATTALTNTISTINSAISGTVTMDQVLQYIEDIKAAGLTFLNNTMPSNNGYYDLTFLIDNPDFTESANGWSLEPTRSYGAVEFYEKTFDLYQILPNMPAGKYQYTVDAFQRPGEPSAVYTAYTGGTNNVNAVMYINSTSQKIKHIVEGQQTTSISNGEFTTSGNTYIPNTMESGSTYMTRNLYHNVMQGEFPAGDLRFGLRGTVSNTYYWTMADNFKLYYLGSDGVVTSLKDQLITEGFNRVTALPNDYSPYFFLLYDHDQDLTMVLKDPNHQGGSKSMWYDMDVNPRTSKEPLWTIDSYTVNGTEYQILANATYPDVMLQTEYNAAWNYRCSDNGAGDPGWGRTSFAYLPNGYWTIQSGVYPQYGYLGPWEGVFTDDAETALNKTENNIGHFDVFSILRGDYVSRFDAGVPNATFENPLDITYVLENPGGERRASIGWTHVGNDWGFPDNNALVGKVGSRFIERWDPNGVGNAEIYQKVQGLPDGYYRFSAIGTRRADETGTFYLYANDEQSLVGSDNDGRRTSVIVQVTDGVLQVGAKAENITKDWIAFDDARIEYLGLSIPGYNVGEPTSNIQEGTYTGTQELTTWTLTFTEANSSVEGAVFAKLDNSAKASLYKGQTKVGEYIIYFSDKTASVSFDGVKLDADATYILQFPAGVVGYAGQVSNEAYSVTFNTPHFFTGTYYLYNKVTDSFLGLTEGTNDAFVTCAGSTITWTVSENGGSIKFNDTNTYLGGFYWSKTDDATGYVWECIPYSEGQLSGYQLRRNPSPAGAWPGDYLYISNTDTDQNRVASNGLIGDNFQDWAYAVWELWTEDEYNAYNNNPDVNNDGMVNVTDVIKLVNIILGNDTDYEFRRADVNGDCLINITDVATLVNMILDL
ncbi:MAG: dockerin type I repeat-containing protein [Prevotella sp.]|nr:dockerin type I repeat-containing protein [Prevotella sp.]